MLIFLILQVLLINFSKAEEFFLKQNWPNNINVKIMHDIEISNNVNNEKYFQKSSKEIKVKVTKQNDNYIVNIIDQKNITNTSYKIKNSYLHLLAEIDCYPDLIINSKKNIIKIVNNRNHEIREKLQKSARYYNPEVVRKVDYILSNTNDAILTNFYQEQWYFICGFYLNKRFKGDKYYEIEGARIILPEYPKERINVKTVVNLEKITVKDKKKIATIFYHQYAEKNELLSIISKNANKININSNELKWSVLHIVNVDLSTLLPINYSKYVEIKLPKVKKEKIEKIKFYYY